VASDFILVVTDQDGRVLRIVNADRDEDYMSIHRPKFGERGYIIERGDLPQTLGLAHVMAIHRRYEDSNS
jgi:hypothetical protein